MDMSLSELRDCEGQESLAGCSPWVRKESDMTEQLNDHEGYKLWIYFKLHYVRCHDGDGAGGVGKQKRYSQPGAKWGRGGSPVEAFLQEEIPEPKEV